MHFHSPNENIYLMYSKKLNKISHEIKKKKFIEQKFEKQNTGILFIFFCSNFLFDN